MANPMRQPAVLWAKENGWSVSLTRGSHIRFTLGKALVIGPSTSSDHRSHVSLLANLRREMRNQGIEVGRKRR